MPQFETYIHFNGNCREALAFYERVLNGKIEMIMTNAESPVANELPPGKGDEILHSRLVFEGGALMAGDDPMSNPYPGMHGFGLSLGYPTTQEAERVFNELAEGGKVTMPFGKTFWADGFGMLVDRFGTPWMVGGGEPKM